MTDLPYVMDGEPCPQCGHPFDPHILVAMGDPSEGGFILCPEDECGCLGTWDVKPDALVQEFYGLWRKAPPGSEERQQTDDPGGVDERSGATDSTRGGKDRT